MSACNEWGVEGEGHEGFVLFNLAIGEAEGYCMMFFMRVWHTRIYCSNQMNVSKNKQRVVMGGVT